MPLQPAANYHALKEEILAQFSEKEQLGIRRFKDHVLKHFLNLGKPISSATGALNFDLADKEKVKAALKGRNLTVMFGAGKDSATALTLARAVQLMIFEEYDGVTFELRSGMGRHPGMLDVGDNATKIYERLQLNNDPLVTSFYIDREEMPDYDPRAPIPESVIERDRNDVLLNGHLYSGAGRGTFCDACNRNLSRWIAMALSYKGGADLFMTGDSLTELNTQIGSDVPKMAIALGIPTDDLETLPPAKRSFLLLNRVAAARDRLAAGNLNTDDDRRIPYEKIPDRTRFVSPFNYVKYDSKQRFEFLKNYLNFDFSTLAFSFTETDCGNPALMAHIYGLTLELSKGLPYVEGVRMYRDFAVGIMRKKGFPDELIKEMERRYPDENDAQIMETTRTVLDYAQRAYRFSPSHLEAMVFAPFTEDCHNLSRYLDHLQKQGHPDAQFLRIRENDIRQMIAGQHAPSRSEALLAEKLERLTGLNLPQMRHLNSMGLVINNFDKDWHRRDINTEKLDNFRQLDSLYIGQTNIQGFSFYGR